VFLCRKGLIHYANTKEASYVEGEDYTLIGSRSGANAVAIWMILMTYGPFGYNEKILILQNRTDWMCKQLDDLQIDYFRNPHCNIITIKAPFVSDSIAKKYGLVPDNHQAPNWYKIVIMEHVTTERLLPLVKELEVEKLNV
jgi:glutamate/tyrosine decarboxylase-like PLP-dependent enzyme